MKKNMFFHVFSLIIHHLTFTIHHLPFIIHHLPLKKRVFLPICFKIVSKMKQKRNFAPQKTNCRLIGDWLIGHWLIGDFNVHTFSMFG
jgi:hypothetical protein